MDNETRLRHCLSRAYGMRPHGAYVRALLYRIARSMK